jgi:hypothetical protein
MITLLYYTANRFNPRIAEVCRDHLRRHGLPIVNVSWQPMKFGEINIAIGTDRPFSPYTLYQQILLGAKAARTKYVATCEDDSLYSPDHFTLRPPPDEFWYDTYRWWLEPPTKARGAMWRLRNRTSMVACVVERELLIETLELRFKAYPEHPPGRWAWRHFGEPGKCEGKLLKDLPLVKFKRCTTVNGCVTINHRDSLGGKRQTSDVDRWESSLTYFGKADDVWKKLNA